jgi:hypothetical protein
LIIGIDGLEGHFFLIFINIRLPFSLAPMAWKSFFIFCGWAECIFATKNKKDWNNSGKDLC